ncbi:MAG: hypothetical protein ACRDWE_00085, partial [Acidimicrobiales bacterium]
TLLGIDERRKVTRREDGTFVANDGREPVELDPDQPVSVNLWGFSPAMHEVLASAMAGPDDGEVLLPDLVEGLLGAGGARPGAGDRRGAGRFEVAALRAPGRCIGVTHPGDVALVTAVLAGEIGRGERLAALWTALLP